MSQRTGNKGPSKTVHSSAAVSSQTASASRSSLKTYASHRKDPAADNQGKRSDDGSDDSDDDSNDNNAADKVITMLLEDPSQPIGSQVVSTETRETVSTTATTSMGEKSKKGKKPGTTKKPFYRFKPNLYHHAKNARGRNAKTGLRKSKDTPLAFASIVEAYYTDYLMETARGKIAKLCNKLFGFGARGERSFCIRSVGKKNPELRVLWNLGAVSKILAGPSYEKKNITKTDLARAISTSAMQPYFVQTDTVFGVSSDVPVVPRGSKKCETAVRSMLVFPEKPKEKETEADRETSKDKQAKKGKKPSKANSRSGK